jgi:hypothetical protein
MPLLYSSSRIEVLHLDAVHEFCTSLPQLNLKCITNLSLLWVVKTPEFYVLQSNQNVVAKGLEKAFSKKDKRWSDVCSTLRRMTGLRELRIRIYMHDVGGLREGILLRELQGVRVPRESFWVELPGIGAWSGEGLISEDEAKEYGFSYQRRGGEECYSVEEKEPAQGPFDGVSRDRRSRKNILRWIRWPIMGMVLVSLPYWYVKAAVDAGRGVEEREEKRRLLDKKRFRDEKREMWEKNREVEAVEPEVHVQLARDVWSIKRGTAG